MNNALITPLIDLFLAKISKQKHLEIGRLGAYDIDGLLRITHPTLGVSFLSIKTDQKKGWVVDYAADRRNQEMRSTQSHADRAKESEKPNAG